MNEPQSARIITELIESCKRQLDAGAGNQTRLREQLAFLVQQKKELES
jgi:hypothetical protein